MTVVQIDNPRVVFQPAKRRLHRPDNTVARAAAAEMNSRSDKEDEAADQRMQDDGAPMLGKLLGRLTFSPLWSALGLRRLSAATSPGRRANYPWRLQLRADRKERWRLRSVKAKASEEKRPTTI